MPIGMNLAALMLEGGKLRIDPLRDVNQSAAIVWDAKASGGTSSVFILGDHLGLSAEARALLGEARSISVGPVSIHADDAVAVVQNELDRCQVSISSMSIGHITT